MRTLHLYSNYHISKQVHNVRKGDWVFLENKMSRKRWAFMFRYKKIDEASLDITYINREEFFNLDKGNTKFNIVGNPPYNESSKSTNTIAGTSGNTTLYKKFIRKAFELAMPDGAVSLVVQRTGVKFALENYTVTSYNLDTSDSWEYTAGYFTSIGNDNSRKSVSNNTILNKVYDITVKKRFRSAMGGSYASHLAGGAVTHDDKAGGVFGIVNTPTEHEGAVTGYILRKPIAAGPKLLFKGLESKKSYYVTDLPAHVGSGCAFMFDTMEEAEAARLFILNNPVVKYLQRVLREKTLGYVFRYMVDFNLSQIKTGFEYPVEWGLTPEEISSIEGK